MYSCFDGDRSQTRFSVCSPTILRLFLVLLSSSRETVEYVVLESIPYYHVKNSTHARTNTHMSVHSTWCTSKVTLMVRHLLFHQHLNKYVDIPENSDFISSHCNSCTTLLSKRKLSAMQFCESDQHNHKLIYSLGSIVVESEGKSFREELIKPSDCRSSQIK